MTLADIRDHFADLGAQFSRMGARVDGAALCDEVLRLIDQVQARHDSGLLSLEEAAEKSGYSPDHLRKLANEGTVHATKRGRRLFFEQAELPRKPRRVARQGEGEYDAEADARRVTARRSHGESHHGSQAAA